MLKIEYRTSSWWYWLATAGLLSAGLGGLQQGFAAAIALTAFQLAHFAVRTRSATAFPVQVRLAYLFVLLVALPQPLQALYWVPTIGTWALVAFGYCTIARMMSLLPWNRSEALSLALLRRTFVSAPVSGSIVAARAHRL